VRVLSINVGLPLEVPYRGEAILTSIFKHPISSQERVWVRKLNIEGDGQADPKYHGGVDMAVYAYGADSFPWWNEKLGRAVTAGEFGENLTLSELKENELCVGDVIESGECRLQVVEPRFPCFKLGIRFDDPGILKTFMESRRPGIYFRVLNEGQIQFGSTFRVIEKDPERVPLLELFRTKIPGEMNREALKRCLNVKSLSDKWRQKITKLLSSNG
jgi:MOSC domain-containing protein YiiM